MAAAEKPPAPLTGISGQIQPHAGFPPSAFPHSHLPSLRFMSKCFSEKLWYELNDQTQDSSEDFFKENKSVHELTLYFTVKKDGKVTNYSFSNDSDALISTTYLKRISKVFKYYEQKGKKIIPASENNKYKDFTITFKVKYKG